MATTAEARAAPANNPAPAGGAAVVPRKRKYSPVGDLLFMGYILLFVGLILASHYKMLPVFKFELMSLADCREWAVWMGENPMIPVYLSVIYVVLVFGGQRYMEDKKPFDLRIPLALWSLALSVFSFVGAVRTVPRVFDVVSTKGWKHLVCGDTRYDWLVDDPAGFWTMIFCLSKIPELIDTAFIVLHKKPLITLHWYHHFTVMLFCWQSWATCCVNGIIFAAMNLTVHTVMYMFYALAALGYRPTTFAQSITAGQIAQMVVGTAVTAYVVIDKMYWHRVTTVDFSMRIPKFIDMPKNSSPPDAECHVSSGNALAGLVMYASYLALFVEFFYSAYIRAPKPGERRKAE